MESLLMSESFAMEDASAVSFPTFRVAICQAIHGCAGYLTGHPCLVRWCSMPKCVKKSSPQKESLKYPIPPRNPQTNPHFTLPCTTVGEESWDILRNLEAWTAQETLETSGPRSPCSPCSSCSPCSVSCHVWLFSCLSALHGCTDGVEIEERMTEDRGPRIVQRLFCGVVQVLTKKPVPSDPPNYAYSVQRRNSTNIENHWTSVHSS